MENEKSFLEQTPPAPKQEVHPLYPERASENIDTVLDAIQKLDSGEKEITPLSEQERGKILRFEESLGSSLEKTFDITPQSAVIHIEYLLTDVGREAFKKTFGVPIEGQDAASVRMFLLENRSIIASAKTKECSSFFGEGRSYSDDILLRSLLETMEANGSVNIRSARNPESVSIALNPEKNLEKIRRLHEFKSQLKKFRKDLSENQAFNENEKRVIQGVLDLYQRRTNEMLVDQFGSAAIIKQEASVIGEESLSKEEKSVLEFSNGLESPEKNSSRLDKFIHGAGSEYDASGWREQVSASLDRSAREIGDAYLTSVLERATSIKSKGLDEKKILEKNISWEEFKEMGDQTLAAYGILSDISSEEYDPSRRGPAQDNKWQFVCRDEYKSFSVDGKRKALKTTRKPVSIGTAIPLLAHEIEGHALQHENKSKVPLRLFRKVGGGRWQVFAECGAMQNQDIVSKEAFGFETIPHPHYIKAMRARLDGGDYLQCVQAFYESALQELRLKKRLGRVDEDEFKKEAAEKLSLAINRTRRLFSNTTFLQSPSEFLTNSRDTVYLEQVELYRKLKERKLEKYAYIGSANLKTIEFLLESGFLDPKIIQQPKFHALKIWESMQEKYRMIS